MVELIHRIHTMLRVYLSTVSPAHIKRKFSTVYQVLDEMVYNGVPCTTEPNALQQMINSRAFPSTTLAMGATSLTPWRKSGVKYNNNEIFFDVVEEIDAIVSSSGMTIMQRVNASIQVNCKLSGYPEVVVALTKPNVIKAPCMHPCIKVRAFDETRKFCFVPPDGRNIYIYIYIRWILVCSLSLPYLDCD